MRAIEVAAYGGRDVLRLVDAPRPHPQPGHLIVRQLFAGVNFADVYMRTGLYRRGHTYASEPPFIMGIEGAGEVSEVGEGVSDFSPGDPVAFCLCPGAYAEYVSVPAWKAVPIPAGIGLDRAAAAMLQGSTAHYLSHSAATLGPGKTCLIHAGAGGVGQLLIQFARLKGSRVLATVGSPEKAEAVRALGAIPILYRETDFREAVLADTGGQGVDVVYDSVGRDTVERSIRTLRVRGLCILFGASSGVVESIVPMDLAEAGSVYFTRPHLAHYMRTAEEVRSRASDIFAALQAGTLRMCIHSVLPLAEAAAAHETLEERRALGKLLLQA